MKTAKIILQLISLIIVIICLGLFSVSLIWSIFWTKQEIHLLMVSAFSLILCLLFAFAFDELAKIGMNRHDKT
jgi:hypothetical protein